MRWTSIMYLKKVYADLHKGEIIKPYPCFIIAFFIGCGSYELIPIYQFQFLIKSKFTINKFSLTFMIYIVLSQNKNNRKKCGQP